MTWEQPPQGPGSWSQRYRDADTPWDIEGPHPELARRLASRDLAPLGPGANALVPGAGYGHDALALAKAGFAVTAIDFADGTRSDVALELERCGGRFLQVDALTYDGGPYDLVFDHTFFCALDPRDRPRWGELMERVVGDDGQLVVLVFPGGKPLDAGGPPFGMELEHVREVLAPDFVLDHVEPVMAPLPRREWRESWARFRRVRNVPSRVDPL